MQGKENIIDGIVASAKSAAAAMIADAEAEAKTAVAAVRVELDGKKSASDLAAEKAACDVYSGRMKLGELESGKIVLGAKRKCVGAVYDRVRELVLGMKDADYLAMLQRLVAENCTDGDVITAAKRDEKRVTAAWVKKVSVASGKKLALAKERGDFAGGVILRNAKYDRDLTLDRIIEDLKERTESETVKALQL
ncbi:MAG: V-type ATP synthase subunit E family protein [Roseburia sp.]|nr:V-type ATP synthase subunit E family protein [Roseburia sp.]